jgi:D-inositol-3-phosphate glycosyltransferase
VGTFDPERYDLDLVLLAIGLVTVPDARLVMVGARSDADTDSIRARAASLGVEDRVEVLPWQAPAALDAIKADLAVGLAPLAITSRNQIGSPLKVLEYLSAGIPVIGSDLTGIRAILDQGPCGLVAENTPAAWAAAIERILTQPSLAESLSRHGLARADDLSWARRAERIHAFLGDLQSGRARSR